MGRFVLASERVSSFTDVTAYILGVALDLSTRRRLLTTLAPLICQIRATRPDDTGTNYKRSGPVPEAISAAPLRVSCPRAYADLFKAREALIEAALGSDRRITFKEFSKLAFLAVDHLCESDPALMARIVKVWPPRYFGL